MADSAENDELTDAAGYAKGFAVGGSSRGPAMLRGIGVRWRCRPPAQLGPSGKSAPDCMLACVLAGACAALLPLLTADWKLNCSA